MKQTTKRRAREWLRQLQRDHFNTHMRVTHAQTMEHLSDSKGYKEMLADPFGYADKKIDRFVVQRLKKYLPASTRSLIEDIPVGTLFTSDPNACAIRPLDFDCVPVVIIDWTFFAFLGQVVSPVLRLLDRIPKEEQRLLARMILHCGEYFTSGGRSGSLDLHEYDEALTNMASAIELGALTFILCHEYAHIILGHLEPNNITVNEAGFVKYNKSWEQEFSADISGLQLSQECLDNLETELYGNAISNLPCASPLIVMSVILFLQRFFGNYGGSPSHPPPDERRSRLASVLDGTLYEHASSVAMWFEHVLSQHWERVEGEN